MRIRDALLSARSYLTILIGFLLGFAIVVWVEKQMPARVESSGGMTLSQDFPPLPPPRELTFDEAIWARVAWQYYVNPEYDLKLAQVGSVLLIGGTEQSLAPFRATEATFLVNDITAWEKHLPSTGATIINPVKAVPTGWNMLVRHPDGMIAEYVEHHDKNPADEIF
ncbi:glyoxalase [Klebsiella pneumoniae]|nr:glyoxalase [Klebsiella pneumoniae]